MKTIVIIGGIILAGATIVAVVQSDRKKDSAPQIHQAGDNHSSDPSAIPANTAGLNPAHGLPGHRCDLAVGAPLSGGSGAMTPAQQPQMIQVTPGQTGTKPASSATPPAGLKVNPAHGLPGHRCDLQVGAPLS
jgi:hypothetical protein